MTHSRLGMHGCVLVLAMAALAVVGCKKKQEGATVSCSALTNSAFASWTPAPSGPSSSYHDSSVAVSKQVFTATASPVGAAQAGSGKEVQVDFDVSSDLGAHGSFTLVARTTSWPGNLVGNGYPLLTSLVDPNGKQYVNLASACVSGGFYTCTDGICSQNTSCTISSPSAFGDRDHWEQHNVVFSGYTSVNSFPTCNWTSTGGPSCPFVTSSWLSSGKLPTGTYHAKFLVMAERYSTMSGYSVGLQVTLVQKADTGASGAVDMNVVLVGNKIIDESRTEKGKANLDLLLSSIHSEYAQAGISIGSIRAIEWSCDQGGDAYASIDSDSLGDMIAAGQSVLPSDTDAKAVNIFMINSFTDNSAILGISGGIGGSPVQGSASSGVAVATYGDLEAYNASCSDSDCPLASQDGDFADLKLTVSHEMGHFLGLNHTSEQRGGTSSGNHDLIPDTPMCSATDSLVTDGNGNPLITTHSCQANDTTAQTDAGGGTCNSACSSYVSGTYCPTITQCGFNHLMWPWSKNFKEGTGVGDGNLISTDSAVLLNYNPLIQ